MSLFELRNEDALKPIKELTFKLEKEIQSITESNLKRIFNFDFVKSEFTIHNLRIDTLGYDKTSNSFIILEYKKDRNFSVIDQGFAYLALMLNNKSDFILEYNEKNEEQIKRGDIDWSQSKVIFIAPSFTSYQREAINFRDLPIELWEIKKYDNNTIGYTQIKNVGATESVGALSRSGGDEFDEVRKQIKVYTETEHIEMGSQESIELYNKLKNAILNLENVDLIPKKKYIAFVGSTNIVDVVVQRGAIKLFLNLVKGELDDPKNIARDVSRIGHWGNGDYEICLSNDENIEYIVSLIRQSHKKNMK